MPIKRRHSKRRRDPYANIETWRSVLECGHDYFNDLSELGIEEPCLAPVDRRDAAQEEFVAASADAWRRHGAAIMELWRPNAVRQFPWAHEEFGAPPCR